MLQMSSSISDWFSWRLCRFFSEYAWARHPLNTSLFPTASFELLWFFVIILIPVCSKYVTCTNTGTMCIWQEDDEAGDDEETEPVSNKLCLKSCHFEFPRLGSISSLPCWKLSLIPNRSQWWTLLCPNSWIDQSFTKHYRFIGYSG